MKKKIKKTLLFMGLISAGMGAFLIFLVLLGLRREGSWLLLLAGGFLIFFLLLGLRLIQTLTEGLMKPIEELAEHQDILKNAKMRQEFTANVTHELKTPLTSISGYAELIETGIASEKEVQRFANGIRKSADRLLTLINDIIRLSELDDPHGEVKMEELNLYQLASSCVEMLEIHAQKHDVTLLLRGEDCMIWGNRQMIEELLYNLCDNAIRYNRADGKVEVEARYRNGKTMLAVRDTGIGISAEHQERIFERFYRVDRSRSKSTGGTGLGLAIVKHIIARHRAEMDLWSQEGKGTCVTVLFSRLAANS